MNLNAPDTNCQYCKGTGARVRPLKLVFDGTASAVDSQVQLHCGCLSPELATRHEAFDNDPVLRDWPWDTLKDLTTPQADGGPTPIILGDPFPFPITPLNPPPTKPPEPAPEPAPAPVSVPNPAKVKKKKSRR